MSAAKKLSKAGTYLESGRVARVAAEIEVVLETGTFPARRAKSCLVEPEVGDRVLCAVEADGVFLLAVLESAESKTTLATQGDLDVVARGGHASITGTKSSVDILSAGSVAIAAGELHARARSGSIAVDELGFFGKLLQAEVGKVAVVADHVDAFMTRMTLKAKRVFRTVEEIDQTRANTIDMRAEAVLALRGENAIVSARVLTKLDGEQVHIG